MFMPKFFLAPPTPLWFETGVFKRVGDLHINPKFSRHAHTDYVIIFYNSLQVSLRLEIRKNNLVRSQKAINQHIKRLYSMILASDMLIVNARNDFRNLKSCCTIFKVLHVCM